MDLASKLQTIPANRPRNEEEQEISGYPNVKIEDVEIYEHSIEENEIYQKKALHEFYANSFSDLDENMHPKCQIDRTDQNSNDFFKCESKTSQNIVKAENDFQIISNDCAKIADESEKTELVSCLNEKQYSSTCKTEEILQDDSPNIEEERFKKENVTSDANTENHTGSILSDSIHLNAKPYKCELCDSSTQKSCNLSQQVEKYKLKKHIETRYSNKHKCKNCNFSADTRSELIIHVEAVHAKLKKHKCESCDYAVHRKCDLNRHINAVHFHLKKFECEFCDFASYEKNRLKKHVDCVHLNLKLYKCDSCDYSASRKPDLKRHVETVHFNLKNYKCDLCDYASHEKNRLKQHVDCVHLNLKLHKCDSCDYSTYRNSDIKRHVETVHLNLKKFKCDLCEFAFHVKSRLKKHVDCVHLNLKLHKCDSCDYGAYQKHSLKKHVETVHFNLKN